MSSQTMMSMIAAEPARSWAQVVKGSEEQAPAKAPVRPAERGSRRCPCHGELLVLLGHYGWVACLDQEIDHPDAGRHGGRVYVSRDDLAQGSSMPKPGDKVDFFLYVDDSGLGAEDCRLAGAAPSTRAPAAIMRAAAEEFVPISAPVDSFAAGEAEGAGGMNPYAVEFVPAAATDSATESAMNPHAAEFMMPQQPLAPSAPAVDAYRRRHLDASAINASRFFFDDDDSDDSDSEDEAWSSVLALRGKKIHEHSDGCSTSADDESTCSDSDFSPVRGTGKAVLALPPPPGLEDVVRILPPPGLDIKPAFPPGLALPPWRKAAMA